MDQVLFNIIGMKNGTDSFLKGTLTILIYMFIYLSRGGTRRIDSRM